MSYSPARWIRAYLLAQGLGSDPDTPPAAAWPFYYSIMPDGNGVVDNVLAAYDTAGKIEGRRMRGGVSIEHPGVMIHARSVSYDDGYSKLKAVADALDAVSMASVTIGVETRVIAAVSRRSILDVGEVPGDRPRSRFSLNAIVSFA